MTARAQARGCGPVADALPFELARLLNAGGRPARDAAWAGFLGAYSPLLLRVTRSLGRSHDAAMDAYAFVLEQLRRDDLRRLRAYAADGRSGFSAWLVCVTRRLCLDHHRRRYGRVRARAADRREARVARGRLVDLVADGVDPASISQAGAATPDTELQASELHAALRAVVSELHPRDRRLLALRFEDDVPVRSIAHALGFPTPFHVYRRLSGVLAALRRSLVQRGVEEARA